MRLYQSQPQAAPTHRRIIPMIDPIRTVQPQRGTSGGGSLLMKR